MKHQRHFENAMDRPGNVVKEHLILGTDKQDAEKQRDLWLSQNPAIKVIKIHRVKREPQTLLTRISRKHVPRVSIMVEYEEPDVRAKKRSRTTPPSEENYCKEYAGGGSYQNPGTNLFAGEADLNVKEMAQGGSGHHRRDENTK